jgi:hypothetical protein
MAQESPTAEISGEIKARLQEFSRKRLRDKRRAFYLKLGAALLGAAVTVLLGLKVPAEYEATLKNVALVAGALVAVLNAWDAFYDHRALWVKRTTTTARLRKLDRAFRIACAGKQDLDTKEVEAFRVTLDQILDDDLSSWIQMRSDFSDKDRSALPSKS